MPSLVQNREAATDMPFDINELLTRHPPPASDKQHVLTWSLLDSRCLLYVYGTLGLHKHLRHLALSTEASQGGGDSGGIATASRC